MPTKNVRVLVRFAMTTTRARVQVVERLLRTCRLASALPAASVTDDAGVAETTAPSTVTLTATVRAAAVSPVRCSVNDAAVPSVTGDETAATETEGSATVTAAVASLASASSVPRRW